LTMAGSLVFAMRCSGGEGGIRTHVQLFEP
jgi:hypothetical protein